MQPHEGYVYCPTPLTRDGGPCYIPQSVSDFFDDEFDYRYIENCDELKDIAVAFFVGLLQPYDVASSGGGGSQSDSPWRDKDDDDMEWARMCARIAALRVGVIPRYKRKR